MPDFEFGAFTPTTELQAGTIGAIVAIYHFEHMQNDGAVVNAELARLNADGTVQEVLCAHGGNFSSTLGDTWALSMATDQEGRAECGTIMANGIITENEAFADIPVFTDELHYGLRVWSDAEGPPPYPQPGTVNASAAAWTVTVTDARSRSIPLVAGGALVGGLAGAVGARRVKR